MAYHTDLRLTKPRAERSTLRFSFLVTDDEEKPIPGSALATVTVQIYDRATGAEIRAPLDILNKNNGTVDANGNGLWISDQSDSRAVGTPSGRLKGQPYEDHVALVKWTYIVGSQTRGGHHEIWHRIIDLLNVS